MHHDDRDLVLDIRAGGVGDGGGHELVIGAAEGEGEVVMQMGDGVIVGKGVVDGHVFEEATDMVMKKAFDHRKVEVRVDEEGAEIGFDGVGEAFGGVARGGPVVRGAVVFPLGLGDFLGVVSVLELDDGAAEAEVFVEAELDGEGGEEFVGDHGHLVLGEPLRVSIRMQVEDEVHANHVEQGVTQKFQTLVTRYSSEVR